MQEEYFDVLNEQGKKTGKTKLRAEVHCDGDWHRAADIFIINPSGEVLLQRRSSIKDSYPDMWDISCGGHLEAGDSSREAAVRELQEELGLDVRPEELKLVLADYKTSKRVSDTFINNSFNDLYILHSDTPISEMVLQESEVAEVKFFTPNELKQMIKAKRSDLVEHNTFYATLFEYLDKNFPKN